MVDRARQTVFRIEPSATAPTRDLPAGASGGEGALLRQAGADRADPNIRATLTREGIKGWELVQIVNLNNGARIETYVIPGERGSGVICLNGPAARTARS